MGQMCVYSTWSADHRYQLPDGKVCPSRNMYYVSLNGGVCRVRQECVLYDHLLQW